MKVKQSIPKPLRYTIRNFNNEFPNDRACLEYIIGRQYPNGVARCEKCGKETKHYLIGNRTAFSCGECGTQIFPLVGTIFEKSSTPLRLWFHAMYLMGSTRCGISAKQVQREVGVTYKTAWRMFKQIRSLLSAGDMQLEGSTVEVDEAYYGGVRKFNRGRPMRGDRKKTPIIGLVERGGNVVAKVIKHAGANELLGNIRNLQDKYGRPANYKHFRIRHKSGYYVRDGHIHTQTVEGFWSLIKRGIGGVYHSVSPKYLQTYLDEYTFRYNRRFEGNLQFKSVLERACRRRHVA